MTRNELTEKIIEAKQRLGLTWKKISEEIGAGSTVFTTAALMGYHNLTPAEAAKASKLLELSEDDTRALSVIPTTRGVGAPMPPTDPLVYRLYEIVLGYGPTLRALIQEEFGDGIMSAIDFDMNVEREANPKGDRVRLVMSGKFLPFKRF
ncbi:MAG TPA: cyanase [Gemmatimonadaceae bacterium]|nr:cyanase [Gemmatimonadaceae bacterium]